MTHRSIGPRAFQYRVETSSIRLDFVAAFVLAAIILVEAPAQSALAQAEMKPNGAETRVIDRDRAFEPVAPVLPGSIVAAMQEKRYDAAIAELKTWAERAKPADKTYGVLIEAIALRLDKKLDSARTLLTRTIQADPDSVWRMKLESELVAVEIDARRFEAAEAILDRQARAVISASNKDATAKIEERIADSILKPEDSSTVADPKAASELLVRASDLARSPAEKARLLLRAAETARDYGYFREAIVDLQKFVRSYPNDKSFYEARYALGECLLLMNDDRSARRTWIDLADELASKRADAALDDLRARSLYRIADTYDLLTVFDDTTLRHSNPLVEAYRRKLEEEVEAEKARIPGLKDARNQGFQSVDQPIANANVNDEPNAAFNEGAGTISNAGANKSSSINTKPNDAFDRTESASKSAEDVERLRKIAERRTTLGIAALERFLAEYPEHPLAVRASFEIAAAREPIPPSLIEATRGVYGSPRVGAMTLRTFDPRSQKILNQLNKPIDMPFPNETPLEEVIGYIKAAVKADRGYELPIYIDPIGLSEADKTMGSTVTIDLKGVPLRTTLELVLAQLGLVYYLEDGVLKITYENSEELSNKFESTSDRDWSIFWVEYNGRAEEAIADLRKFLAGEGYRAIAPEAKADFDRLAPIALVQLGRMLKIEDRIDEAIERWNECLKRFPNGVEAAASRGLIRASEIEIADRLFKDKKYEEARTKLRAFIDRNPLDRDLTRILHRIARSYEMEKRYADAIAVLRDLARRFPNHDAGEYAELQIATLLRYSLDKPDEAIRLYEKIAADPSNNHAETAAQMIQEMKESYLSIRTPRKFRSGEKPHVVVAVRNIDKLTFSAYKLDPVAYFRKKHALWGVESLDIGLVAADFEWTVKVPGYAKYMNISANYDLPKIAIPGVWAIKVSDDKSLQATTLLIGGDVDAIVEASREQILVFAQDMKTGKGRAGARVLVSDGSRLILDAKTGADGVLLADWNAAADKAPKDKIGCLVVDGGGIAATALQLGKTQTDKLKPNMYLVLDRSKARPGETVSFWGTIRGVRDGKYVNDHKSKHRVEIVDPPGRKLFSKPIEVSTFGTFHDRIELPANAAEGSYKITLLHENGDRFDAFFEVDDREPPRIELAIDLDRTSIARGEPLTGTVKARDDSGAAIAGRTVSLKRPDGRIDERSTDAAGTFRFEFDTRPFDEEGPLTVEASVPEENVSVKASAGLSLFDFDLAVKTDREVYHNGETVNVVIEVSQLPGGFPKAGAASVAVVKRDLSSSSYESVMVRSTVAIDPKTRVGKFSFTIDEKIDHYWLPSPSFFIAASATDRFGNRVQADHEIGALIEPKSAAIVFRGDRSEFRVGEEAKLELDNRGDPATILFTYESNQILSYRLIDIHKGLNPVVWTVPSEQAPNCRVSAIGMIGRRLVTARRDLTIERGLKVSIKAVSETVKPGGAIELDIETVDRLGKPVSAELAVAVVDRLIEIESAIKDPNPIAEAFHKPLLLNGLIEAGSTNGFDYHSEMINIEDRVDDESRDQSTRADQEASGRVRDLLNEEVSNNPPAFDGKAEARRSNGMTGRMMMGGMGGMGGQGDTPRMKGSRDADASSDRLPREARGDDQTGKNAKAQQLVPPKPDAPRSRFVATAYWNPKVVTDASGKAKIRFDAPRNPVVLQARAWGTTESDEPLVGAASTEIRVNSSFFIKLHTPAYLNEGDKPIIAAEIVNRGTARGEAKVKLVVGSGDRTKTIPRTVAIEPDRSTYVEFDAVEVPSADSLSAVVSAELIDLKDSVETTIPIRRRGIRVFATAAGTARDDTTTIVSLPPGPKYDSVKMHITIAPAIERFVIDAALGRVRTHEHTDADNTSIEAFGSPRTVDLASSAIAKIAAFSYIKKIQGTNGGEAAAAGDAARTAVSFLIAAQNSDGGFPAIVERKAERSDPIASARAVAALIAARADGLTADPAPLDKGAAYLITALAKLDSADLETKISLIRPLAARGKANFEQANALLRMRSSLSDRALAELASILLDLDRRALAEETVHMLIQHGKSERVPAGAASRTFWTDPIPAGARDDEARGSIETTAIVASAIARIEPKSATLAESVNWLVARRAEIPASALGDWIVAVSAFYGEAKAANDRYTLAIRVEDREVGRIETDANASTRSIEVPVDVLKLQGDHHITFDIEGRGTYGYAIELSGFSTDFAAAAKNAAGVDFAIEKRVFEAGPPIVAGEPLPTGFSIAVHPVTFDNIITKVALGARSRTRIVLSRPAEGRSRRDRDGLIVIDHPPAGVAPIVDSIQSHASAVRFRRGELIFWFAPGIDPGTIVYDSIGTISGDYLAPPVEIASARDASRRVFGTPGGLEVLKKGEASDDPYRPTPDELLARGKRAIAQKHYDIAARALEPLFENWTLRDEIAEDAAAILFDATLQGNDPHKIVRYGEIFKEKSPDKAISFDNVNKLGDAYRSIGEFERACEVRRALIDASRREDASIAEILRGKNRPFEAIAFALDLWRRYPIEASVQSDLFTQAQLLINYATRHEADAGKSAAAVPKSELLFQAIRLIQVFLGESPLDPIADEAALAQLGAFLELEDDEAVIKLADRDQKLFPRSEFVSGFAYAEALGLFRLGRFDRAIEVARRIAETTRTDREGDVKPDERRLEALYLMGQIHEARNEPALALDYYKQVSDRYPEAAIAVAEYTRKQLSIPDATTLREPNKSQGRAAPHAPAANEADEAKAEPKANAEPDAKAEPKVKAEPDDKAEPDAHRVRVDSPSIEIKYRNVESADVKVYPVDLMRLYVERRGLDRIESIDLAGITPLVETTVKLGDGRDFEEKIARIPLPIQEHKAYLVTARGGDLYASGVALFSPLSLDVVEDAAAGKARVAVRDAATDKPISKVLIKAIGTENKEIITGYTDPRGVFLAEGIRGTATIIARRGFDEYAIHRGRTRLGPPPVVKPETDSTKQGPVVAPQQAQTPAAQTPLDQSLKELNERIMMRQMERSRRGGGIEGGMGGMMGGGMM